MVLNSMTRLPVNNTRSGGIATPFTGYPVRNFRVALYDVTSGRAEEAIKIARAGFKPILEEQPGFVRYEVADLDSGGIVSFSVWETAAEAQRAVELADEWVRDNLADRERLREEHTGDVAWNDPA